MMQAKIAHTRSDRLFQYQGNFFNSYISILDHIQTTSKIPRYNEQGDSRERANRN